MTHTNREVQTIDSETDGSRSRCCLQKRMSQDISDFLVGYLPKGHFVFFDVSGTGDSIRLPPLFAALAVDGYREESVMFILALTTEPVLTWAATRVRIITQIVMMMIILIIENTHNNT